MEIPDHQTIMPATRLMTIFLTSGKWSNWDPDQNAKLKI
jgi:hypothetical protein